MWCSISHSLGLHCDPKIEELSKHLASLPSVTTAPPLTLTEHPALPRRSRSLGTVQRAVSRVSKRKLEAHHIWERRRSLFITYYPRVFMSICNSTIIFLLVMTSVTSWTEIYLRMCVRTGHSIVGFKWRKSHRNQSTEELTVSCR